MKIYLASDHAGFEYKALAYDVVSGLGHEVVDCGPTTYDPTDDYPPSIARAAQAVLQDVGARGIVFGGSGQGEAMEANRFKGIRAAVYYGGSEDIIRLSREHNDANILSIGARFVDKNHLSAIIKLWLATAFSGDERHVRRIAQLDANELL